MGVEINTPVQARTVGRVSAEFYRNGGSATTRSTFERHDINSIALAAPASGNMLSVGIPLWAGDVVTNVGFRSGTTPASAPTAWFFALYSDDLTPALLAQTANQGSTAWAASTNIELALTAPITVTRDGLYYLGFSMTATTVPTLAGASLQQNAISTGIVTGQRPLAQTSGAALGGTAPATITAASASVTYAYAWVR